MFSNRCRSGYADEAAGHPWSRMATYRMGSPALLSQGGDKTSRWITDHQYRAPVHTVTSYSQVLALSSDEQPKWVMCIDDNQHRRASLGDKYWTRLPLRSIRVMRRGPAGMRRFASKNLDTSHLLAVTDRLGRAAPCSLADHDAAVRRCNRLTIEGSCCKRADQDRYSIYHGPVHRPLVRLTAPRLWVGDTGVLMNEVVQGLRKEHLTGLLATLHHDAARLYVATHVLVEMERHLPQYAASRGEAPELATERWHTMYLPTTVVVEVPDTWGADDERMMSVANRHPVDLPTARLAVALAPCHALIQDPDLTANGFGDKDWLPLTLASANQAEMELFAEAGWIPSMLTVELAKSAGRAFSKPPGGRECLPFFLEPQVSYLWQRNDVAKRHLQRMGDLATRAIEVVGPPVSQVFERYTEAQATWETNVVEPGPERTLSGLHGSWHALTNR